MEDLASVVNAIESTVNPLSILPEDVFYTIVTGREVPDDVRDDIVN